MSKKNRFQEPAAKQNFFINWLKEPDGKQKSKTKRGPGAWCPAKSPRNSASKGPVPIFLGLCWVPGSWADFLVHQAPKPIFEAILPFIREVGLSSEK